MRQSRRSKDCSRKRRSLQRVTGKAGARGGRSEMRSQKQKGNGSCSLTQTETYTPGCSKDLLPLRMTLISLLAQNESAKLTIGGRSLHFSPGFILQFFSELAAIRKRELKSSGDHLLIDGPQMGFCSTSKYYPVQFGKVTKSLKSPSNVKSKRKCH